MESQFDTSDVFDSSEEKDLDTDYESNEHFLQFMRYLISSSVILIALFVILIVIHILKRGQKTRNPQQRRQYMGARPRPSLAPAEPTIYVSPANLPPPPKYEALAPPSYEEVVGIHYPGYQAHVQPITQPITAAMAQCTDSSQNSGSSNSSNENNVAPATVITVTADSRTSVTATS
ncbi:uncharacterized protein [Epargyreus clarus]|uniref:uncharacterized protein isoform X1 n=1 Tax=Epargyreus clarus TaxID=520877 RepID=UPI003C2AEF19